MNEAKILDPRCRIIAATPNDAQHYFGFHDVTPWNEADSLMAILRVPLGLKQTPSSQDRAEICTWDPANGTFNAIAQTSAFNWQQGARLQWFGQTQLLFNDLAEGQPVSRILDIDNKIPEHTIPAIYSLDPQRRIGLAPDWWRLSSLWRDYSYDLQSNEKPKCGKPGDLRAIDLDNGAERVLIPISEIREVCGQTKQAAGSDFISHATFSPEGTRFCFMYRRFSEDGALFSFFLVANRDGSEVRLLAREKCSHFDWIDEDQLVLWTRRIPTKAAGLRSSGVTRRFPFKQAIWLLRRLNPKIKQSLFSEMYYRLDYRKPNSMVPLGSGILEQDGHPMFTKDRSWMLTDTYSYEGNQPLILFNMESNKRTDIVSFPVHSNFREPSLKCDLHPRLNRKDSLAAVDSGHSGERQIYIVELSNCLSA